MENYKEKYECALETIQEILSSGSDSIMMSRLKLRLQSVFPELKESEEKKIVETIKCALKSCNTGQGYIVYNDDYDKCIAWLEKQGEQKKSYDTCNSSMMNNKKSPIGEKRDFGYFEEKSADKVEPKFKVGDWILYSGDHYEGVRHITKINEDGYYIERNGLPHGIIPFNHEICMRLWTIQDAKEGDVLVDSLSGDNQITILFKCIELDTSIRAYCGWNCYNFRVTTDGTGYGTLSSTKYVPATKEQRDLLFQEMEKAGYQWNAEKKELVKIDRSPKFHVGDWVVCECGEDSSILQIKNIVYGTYEFTDDSTLDVVDEDSLRLWTIKDAKDGDILVGSYGTFIFIGNGYCGVLSNNTFIRSTGNNEWTKDLHPATKEQCNILFQKMKESGYQWDTEKKELKKINSYCQENCKGYQETGKCFADGGCDAKRKAEQKSVEDSISKEKTPYKVETKFKVGDWILIDKPCQIVCINNNGNYVVQYWDTEGTHILSKKFCDSHFHLWTIQDAKEGDVLAEDTCIFIIQKLGDNSTAAKTYCTLYNDGDFDDGTILYFDIDSTKPATKEQRDLLFAKMKDAGYEWDAEKKELKKVGEGDLTEFENALVDICRGWIGEEHGWKDYIIKNSFPLLELAKKQFDEYEQKPTAWSDEDERERKRIIGLLEGWMSTFKETYYAGDCKCGIDWLKSLKERMTWKPSEEQIHAFIQVYVWYNNNFAPSETLTSLYNDLKKL